MCQHEQKYCPACNRPFECKAGSILLCQCSSVALSAEEREQISRQYTGCLCQACLIHFKEAHPSENA